MSTTHSYTYRSHAIPDPPHQPWYLQAMLLQLRADPSIEHVLDCGCGDGNFTDSIASEGYTCYGIDASESGVAIGQERYPYIRFAQCSVYDDLRTVFPGQEQFDAIVAIEVIEHLYSPCQFVARVKEALRPGGRIIVTTPYWGYLKNVLIAVTGRTDRALTALWEGGHIKHFSFKTITELFARQGFECVGFHGAGRPIPYLWSGMLVVFKAKE